MRREPLRSPRKPLDDPGREGCHDGGCAIGEGNAVVGAIRGEDIVSVALDVGNKPFESLRCVEGLDVDGAVSSVHTVFDGTYLNGDGDVKGGFKGFRDFLCRGSRRSIGDHERHCVCVYVGILAFFISIFFSLMV
jgi:hypothetical protein